MSSTLESTPDLAAVKQRQRLAWAGGDFAVVASRIVLVAEHLCDTADLPAGWRVLDVATGSGNAAIAAARLGCTAVGIEHDALEQDLVALARRFDRLATTPSPSPPPTSKPSPSPAEPTTP